MFESESPTCTWAKLRSKNRNHLSSGSDKTTTMKMVNRLVEPTSGRVLVEGKEVGEHDPMDKPANDFVEQFLGYQRFHLSLSTRTIGDVIHDSPIITPDKPEVIAKTQGRLSIRDSLVIPWKHYKSTRA